MDLQEFVSSCVEQLATAIANLDKSLAAQGVLVNPTLSASRERLATEAFAPLLRDERYSALLLRFDVALSVSRENSEAAGGKLSVASFLSAGGEHKGTDSRDVTSRIAFTLPVVLPVGDAEAEQRQIEAMWGSGAGAGAPRPRPWIRRPNG